MLNSLLEVTLLLLILFSKFKKGKTLIKNFAIYAKKFMESKEDKYRIIDIIEDMIKLPIINCIDFKIYLSYDVQYTSNKQFMYAHK